MNTNMQRSLVRANALLNAPYKSEECVSIKIKPLQGGCCCFHCWPETWAFINDYISPYGPIEDEGDARVVVDGNEFVLECHESGPEIIAAINSITAVINFVTAIIKARFDEIAKRSRKQHSIEVIIRRIERSDECIEEVIFRADHFSPQLAKEVRKAFQNSKLLLKERGIKTKPRKG